MIVLFAWHACVPLSYIPRTRYSFKEYLTKLTYYRSKGNRLRSRLNTKPYIYFQLSAVAVVAYHLHRKPLHVAKRWKNSSNPVTGIAMTFAPCDRTLGCKNSDYFSSTSSEWGTAALFSWKFTHAMGSRTGLFFTEASFKNNTEKNLTKSDSYIVSIVRDFRYTYHRITRDLHCDW